MIEPEKMLSGSEDTKPIKIKTSNKKFKKVSSSSENEKLTKKSNKIKLCTSSSEK